MKALKIITIILAVIMALSVLLTLFNLIPPKQSSADNPFIVGEGNLPMIAAHRGGGKSNPENTLLAFREAVYTYGVDIIESDLFLTKDGYLVYNHDGYIDETCDVNGDIPWSEVRERCKTDANRHYIKDMTLEELKEYNFGYYFSKGGQRLYKETEDIASAGLQIATAEMLFEEFYESHPDLLFILEIKDSGNRGREAVRVLNGVLEKYPEYKDNVVIGSFHSEIELELQSRYPTLMRSPSIIGAGYFILTHLTALNFLDQSDFVCLQIPMKYDLKHLEVRLDFKSLIDRAHSINIAVQYWTINKEEDMRRLIELGCDCIITDDPALLNEVLADYR